MSRTLLTLADASAYVGLDEKTLRRYVSQGRLRAFRVGPRAIRIDAAELEALIRPIPSAATRAEN